MNNQTNLISTIEDTYGQGLKNPDQIKYKYSNPDKLPQLYALDDKLKSIIDSTEKIIRNEMNLKGPVMSWGKDRDMLWTALRNDYEWQDVVNNIVKHVNPDLLGKTNPEDIYKSIGTPDWAGVTLASSGDSYDPVQNVLTIDATYSHNIFKQIRLSGIDAQNSTAPLGQTNIVFTKDGYVVMGLRGGGTWANTFHGIGSGAIQLYLDKNHPVYDTVYGEIDEEAKVPKNKLKNVAVVGKVIDHVLGGVVVYISKCEVDMTVQEFVEHMKSTTAKDKAEHTAVKAHNAKVPEELVQLFAMNCYKKEYVDPVQPKKVTPMNLYTVLPNSVSGLITALAAQYLLPIDWVPHAVGLTNGVIGMSNRLKNCYR